MDSTRLANAELRWWDFFRPRQGVIVWLKENSILAEYVQCIEQWEVFVEKDLYTLYTPLHTYWISLECGRWG